MKRKQELMGSSIEQLKEALEYVINQELQNIKFLQEMIDTQTDELKIAKAYREMRAIVKSLRPVQYLVEVQAPGMKEIFKQFEGK